MDRHDLRYVLGYVLALTAVLAVCFQPANAHAEVFSFSETEFAVTITGFDDGLGPIAKPAGLLIFGSSSTGGIVEMTIGTGTADTADSTSGPLDPSDMDVGDAFSASTTAEVTSASGMFYGEATIGAEASITFDASMMMADTLIFFDVSYALAVDSFATDPATEMAVATSTFLAAAEDPVTFLISDAITSGSFDGGGPKSSGSDVPSEILVGAGDVITISIVGIADALGTRTIPEPTSATLLCLGGLLVGCRRRRVA